MPTASQPGATTGPTAVATSVEALRAEHCLDESEPAPATAPAPGWSFRDVAAQAGIRHTVGGGLPPSTHPMESLTGAVAVADYDGDGWPDFYVADVGADKLYRNRGNGTFEDVTAASGIQDRAAGRAALWLDHDGDGDADLFVANYAAPSRLWRNDGGTFTDVAAEAGVRRTSLAHGAAAADIDGDGDLDLSVVNYGPWPQHSSENNADARDGEQDFLYVNQGDGTFRDEAVARGFAETKWSFSHAWADFDRDGDQDLYHNVDFGVDELWINDGAGRFADQAKERGMFTDGNGMGAVWLDFDNDHDLDLFATAIHIRCNQDVPQFTGNDLFRNDGGRFSDVAADVGVADGGWGWDSEWADFDHDGDLDGLQATGFQSRGPLDRYHDARVYLADAPPTPPAARNSGSLPSTAYQKYNATHYVVWSFYPPISKADVDNSSQGGHQQNRFFLNEGGRFRDAAAQLGFGGWADTRSIAAIDYDRDGDMDLLRSSWRRPLELFHNPAVEDGRGRWLQLDLVPQRPGGEVGAIVEASAGTLRLTRLAAASGGFISQSDAVVHLGLADAATVDELVVTWPSGKTTRLTDVAADRRIAVEEP